MKRSHLLLPIFATAFVLVGSTPGWATDPVMVPGEGSCLGVIESFGLPLALKTDGGLLTHESADQVDRTLILLRRALQGKTCALRFSDIFRPPGDSPYFPLTNYLLSLAPDLTFRDLPLHGRDGRLVGHLVRRVSIDDERDPNSSEISLPFYYFNYRTGQGEVTSSGNRLLFSDYLLNWRDLETRWALDTYSDGERLSLAGREYR